MSNEHIDPIACRKLWRHVIISNIAPLIRSGYVANCPEYDAGDVVAWMNSDDFDFVCTLAGFDATRARAWLKRRIERRQIRAVPQ